MLRKGDGARAWFLGAALACLPDLDLLAFPLGIPYAHPWGHRGATHSAFMALLLAVAAAAAMRGVQGQRLRLGAYFALAALSHGLLDMATSGGLGVALAWPFSEARWFWPRRPIRVSPIGLSRFLGPRGLVVLRSEGLWILPPVLAAFGGRWLWGRRSLEASPDVA